VRLLQVLQPLLPLRQILFCHLRHLLRLVVQYHQIPIHEVEAVQLVTGLLRIHNVVVNNERGAFGGGGGASADLADGAEFAEEVEEGGRVDVVGEVFDKEDAVRFRGELLAGGHGCDYDEAVNSLVDVGC
jgi:hypothetical protein